MPRLFEPVDIASIAAFRIAFGVLLAWESWRYLDKGRIASLWLEPKFHFTYEGFDWVQPWQGSGMYLHFLAMCALAISIAAGFCYRASACGFFLAFAYVFLLDKAQYLNHFYLITLMSFLMIFVPAHRAFSVDAAIRPKLRSPAAPRWSLWLLRFQLAIVYSYAAFAKMNGDWLRGQPMTIWLEKRTDFPLIGHWFDHDWAGIAFSYGGLLVDLLVVPLLLWKRTRLIAFAMAIPFHLMNSRMFNIGVFPWFMIAATTLFLPPGWPRWIPGMAPVRLVPNPTLPRRWRLACALLALYVFAQAAIPWRRFLYPGATAWTEEGHRFSWRMMLRSKNARIRFFATDPATRATWEIFPRDYLTRDQIGEMSARPDMILQFSHFLSRSAGRGAPLEMRVTAAASLNGRKCQELIDSTVNLAAEPRSIRPARWIVPLREPLPAGPEWKSNRGSCVAGEIPSPAPQ